MKNQVTVKLQTSDFLIKYEDAEVYPSGDELVVETDDGTVFFNRNFVIWYRERQIDV